MNYETFIQQATEFKQLDYDSLNKIIKFISIADESHPWTVMRAAELLNWIISGEYKSFIGREAANSSAISTKSSQVDIDAIFKTFK